MRRKISTTVIDSVVLDAMTDGFITAALWADCLPPTAEVEFRDNDTELVEFALMRGATREYVADADTDRLLADYGEAWQENAESGGRQNLEPTPALRERARLLCARFLAANTEDIEAHMEAFGDPDGGHPGEYVGHTFYLNAAGHGVSFTDQAWRDDDPLTPVCERLRASADSFGEVEHMVVFDRGDGTADLG